MHAPLKNLVLILVAVIALPGCGEDSTPVASKTAAPKVAEMQIVKIGTASQVTGAQASIGTDVRNGVQLAIEDANKAGISIGGKPVKFQMVGEDDEANPTKAATVAQKLADAKVSAVVGHWNSGCSIPASRIYAEAGIPQISPGTTNPDYTLKGYKTTFRLVAHDGLLGPALANFAIEKLKAGNFAVIDDSTAYGQGMAESFENAVKTFGGNVVAREHTTDKDTDFKAILTKIKGKNPDLIMFGGIYPQAAPMVKQMAELGITAKLLSGDGIQTPDFIMLAGDAAEGTMASAPGQPKDQMPGGTAFLEKYKARFRSEVVLHAPMAYDAVFVFIEAMKRAGSADPAKFLPEVGKTNYQGVIGSITFDDKGDLNNSPITIYIVKNGQWEPLETVMSGATAIAQADVSTGATK